VNFENTPVGCDPGVHGIVAKEICVLCSTHDIGGTDSGAVRTMNQQSRTAPKIW
jgi:hypothetical protein